MRRWLPGRRHHLRVTLNSRILSCTHASHQENSYRWKGEAHHEKGTFWRFYHLKSGGILELDATMQIENAVPGLACI